MRTLIVSPSVMREFQNTIDPELHVPFDLQIGGCTMRTESEETKVIVNRHLPGFEWFAVEAPRVPYIVHIDLQ